MTREVWTLRLFIAHLGFLLQSQLRMGTELQSCKVVQQLQCTLVMAAIPDSYEIKILFLTKQN